MLRNVTSRRRTVRFLWYEYRLLLQLKIHRSVKKQLVQSIWLEHLAELIIIIGEKDQVYILILGIEKKQERAK